MYKALIVEDELLVCRGLSVLVDWESLGFRICGYCSDGLTAQKQLELEHYDVLLCDLHIPGIDGLELIHWIRKQSMPMQIIIITAHAEFEYARQAISEDVCAYLLKPVDEALLEDALRHAAEALRRYEKLQSSPAQEKRGTADTIGSIVQEIHNNLGKGITVDRLAREHFMTVGQLNHLFLKRFHIRTKEYIRNAQLERAKLLLKQSDRMIHEIAMEVGFSDVDYFTRWFRQMTGISPTNYRSAE